MSIILLSLAAFFGGIAYLITNDPVAALVIGAGWWIIGLAIFFAGAAILDIIDEWRRKRRNAKRAAEREARANETYAERVERLNRLKTR